jgi:hypothetical protein
MDKDLEILDVTVAELLKSTPSTVRFFISQHTSCVGCRLAHFCTLHDVIKTYELDQEKFLIELSKYIVQKKQ